VHRRIKIHGPSASPECSRLLLNQILALVLLTGTLVGCGGGGSSAVPAVYSISATVAGLSGSGLVLSLASGANTTVNSNGAITLAMGLSNGATYTVTVGAQPTSPVQTCAVVDGSGTVNAANANVNVSCVAGTENTVPATVRMDSSVPSSATAAITSIVSPLDSQAPGKPVFVPISANAGESLVLATDANNNIVLASLLTTTSVNLSATSTALALTRILMGALPATASGSQINAAIEATNEFPNLVSLVTAALAANTSAATSTEVFTSIGVVISQLPATVLATLSLEKRPRVLAAAAPVVQPSITTTQSNIVTTTAGGTVIGAVSISGASSDGGAEASNSTAIAWSLASATTSGQLLCAPGTPASTNDPDCAVLLPRTALLTNASNALSGGSVSTEEIGGNGAAFNVTLEQNVVSKTANVSQIAEDIVQAILGIVSAGTDAPYAACIQSVTEAFLPPAQLSSLVLNTSTSAVISYLGEVILDPVNIVKAYNSCPNVNVVQLPTGSNPLGPVSFTSALIQFIVGVSEYAETQFLNGTIGLGQVAVTTFGIPLEISETDHFFNFSGVVGVCEAPMGQTLEISNCAASFTFSAPVITMAPNGTFVPVLQALDINGNPTLTPADLVYSSPQNPSVINLNTSTGAVVAQPLPSGTTTASATVTATEASTGINASYTVNVNSGGGCTINAAGVAQIAGTYVCSVYCPSVGIGETETVAQNGASLSFTNASGSTAPGTISPPNGSGVSTGSVGSPWDLAFTVGATCQNITFSNTTIWTLE
jgi:hypothetical protein